MESAESSSAGRPQVTPTVGLAGRRGRLRDAIVVLQLDGAVAGFHGLAWLTARRDDATGRRLADLQVMAMAEGWSRGQFDCERLATLRPRRAEVNALGQAYLAALSVGAVDAAHRLRSAGVALELSGEVAVEAMLGVADALGVTPDGIHAPRLRFDALGAFVSADAAPLADVRESTGAGRSTRVYVGTRASELLADPARDVYVRFTGVVAHEGPTRGESVGSFGELVKLLLG